MANGKTIYADGDVIFREDDPCEHTFEVLSGSIDLLKRKDGKYARRGSLEAGDTYGKANSTYDVTLRARGRTVIRPTAKPTSRHLTHAPQAHQPARKKENMIGTLIRYLGTTALADTSKPVSSPYSNPSMIRRLLDGLSSDNDRIGVRVAHLTGDKTLENTRHIITALGNTDAIQTKGFNRPIKIDLNGDVTDQLDRIASASRKWLALQGADILVWGDVPPPGKVIHLRFMTLTNWDQQAPGAFDLETELTLPVNFAPQFADLLRVVTLAAALPQTDEKNRLRLHALGQELNNGAMAFNVIPSDISPRDRANIYTCFANALATASRPGYDPELLSQAMDRYRAVLSMISKDSAPIDWAKTQKHLGSILHIEADRNNDANLLDDAITAFDAANSILNRDHHPHAWATLQNRLGLISYRQGFEEGDTKLLRRALTRFTNALTVYTKTGAPLRWAEIMSNFAQSAQVLGGHLQSMEALATAANASRAVLEVRSRKKMPQAWAATQNNLGSALFLLAKHSRNTDRLRAAIEAFEHAHVVYNGSRSHRLAAVTKKNLDRAKSTLDLWETNDMSHVVWEDILFEDSADQKPKRQQQTLSEDTLPTPGEALTNGKTSVGQDWARQAV